MSDQKQIVGVILAAGLGNRLRPSTLYCPKPLIPVAGVEPLYFALYQFQKMGIKKVIVNVHYLPTQITDSLLQWKSRFEGMDIRISYEMSEILGTGGALLKIIEENSDWLSSSGLLLQNGDTLAAFNLERLVEDAAQSTLAVSHHSDFLKKYNPLWLESDGSWAGIGKEAKSETWVAAHFFGVHYLSPIAVKAIKTFCGELRHVDLFNGIYRPLADHDFKFKSVEFLKTAQNSHEFWFDMNNKEFLLSAQEFLLSQTHKNGWIKVLEHRHPGIKEVQKGVWIKSVCDLSSISFLSPVVFVDDNDINFCHLNQKVNMGPSVSWVQEKNLENHQQPQNIKNAVVMLKKVWRHDIPQNILDDIVLA